MRNVSLYKFDHADEGIQVLESMRLVNEWLEILIAWQIKNEFHPLRS